MFVESLLSQKYEQIVSHPMPVFCTHPGPPICHIIRKVEVLRVPAIARNIPIYIYKLPIHRPGGRYFIDVIKLRVGSSDTWWIMGGVPPTRHCMSSIFLVNLFSGVHCSPLRSTAGCVLACASFLSPLHFRFRGLHVFTRLWHGTRCSTLLRSDNSIRTRLTIMRPTAIHPSTLPPDKV